MMFVYHFNVIKLFSIIYFPTNIFPTNDSHQNKIWNN